MLQQGWWSGDATYVEYLSDTSTHWASNERCDLECMLLCGDQDAAMIDWKVKTHLKLYLTACPFMICVTH